MHATRIAYIGITMMDPAFSSDYAGDGPSSREVKHMFYPFFDQKIVACIVLLL